MDKKLQLQLQLALNQAVATDLDVYNQYVGKKVLIELSSSNVSLAKIGRHGADLVELRDYQESNTSLRSLMEDVRIYLGKEMGEEYRTKLGRRLNRTMRKSEIASIQLLEDVLQGENPEKFFKEEN